MVTPARTFPSCSVPPMLQPPGTPSLAPLGWNLPTTRALSSPQTPFHNVLGSSCWLTCVLSNFTRPKNRKFALLPGCLGAPGTLASPLFTCLTSKSFPRLIKSQSLAFPAPRPRSPLPCRLPAGLFQLLSPQVSPRFAHPTTWPIWQLPRAQDPHILEQFKITALSLLLLG